MKLLKKLLEARKNHMGEREFETYAGWKRAVKQKFPGKQIEWIGDKDIGEAHIDGHSVGEWDGAKGSIYHDSPEAYKKTPVHEGFDINKAEKELNKLPALRNNTYIKDKIIGLVQTENGYRQLVNEFRDDLDTQELIHNLRGWIVKPMVRAKTPTTAQQHMGESFLDNFIFEEKKYGSLTIKGDWDSLDAVKALLAAVHEHGAPGHSFSIAAVDGKTIETNLGSWDGDGGAGMEIGEIVMDEKSEKPKSTKKEKETEAPAEEITEGKKPKIMALSSGEHEIVMGLSAADGKPFLHSNRWVGSDPVRNYALKHHATDKNDKVLKKELMAAHTAQDYKSAQAILKKHTNKDWSVGNHKSSKGYDKRAYLK